MSKAVRLNKEETASSSGERPVVVWESSGGGSRTEETVRSIPLGPPGEAGRPAIRIFSTGFGQRPSGGASAVRMAA